MGYKKLICKKSFTKNEINAYSAVDDQILTKYQVCTNITEPNILYLWVNDLRFLIDKNGKTNKIEHVEYIWDWFYTEPEIRKLKLEKIGNN